MTDSGKPTRPDDDPYVGRTFDGYRADAVIGRGGMGVVYRATQLSLGRPVAVKVLPDHVADHPQFLERFRREVDVLSRLSHPNVVTVMERGEVDGRPYIVMEYVEGESLRDVVKRGPLPRMQALAITRAVLAALEHAHDRGVIHRDIKPENVLVARGDVVKVADFGLGRLLGPADATRLTHTALMLGTFEYMAPEQREKAKDADERSDLYAAGVLFYEMLTGELPIGRFELPSERRPGECDRRIDAIVERSLDKSPDKRYQHASEMGAAVSELLTASPAPAPAPAPPLAPAPQPAPARAPWSQDWRFAIALTALWVLIVMAATEFDMRNEEWTWLVVGALVSVWIIPRFHRIVSNLRVVAAIGLLVLLGISTLFLGVSAEPAPPPDEDEFPLLRADMWSVGTVPTEGLHPGAAKALVRSDDARRWIGRAGLLDIPQYPSSLDVEVLSLGPTVTGVPHSTVRVRLDPVAYRNRRDVSLGIGACLARALPGFERATRGDAAEEARFAAMPPPGEASESFEVGTYSIPDRRRSYPDGLAAVVRSLPLAGWIRSELPEAAGGFPAGASLEYDRGALWVRLDREAYPDATVRRRLAAALTASVGRTWPARTHRTLRADPVFEEILTNAPPPGLPVVRIDEEARK